MAYSRPRAQRFFFTLYEVGVCKKGEEGPDPLVNSQDFYILLFLKRSLQDHSPGLPASY